MDMLIDVEHFKHRLEITIKTNKDMDCLDFMRICYLLDTEPVVFDKEKVLEKIAEIMNDESIRFVEQAVNESIGIVKKGGVE